ncbi:PepSY domain-containing protein [Methylopila sp. M107]|uniref:PepSY domain-containing protein n=1 Tax=Methylopila sp. M107 TaxID=1101190 RepID=UPI00036F8651|nr:PepSY domain-containing protein [Methylopila sp. M107]
MPRSCLPAVLLIAALCAGHAATRAAEQDEARAALQRGEIRPLEQVLDAARREVPGDVVKVELERDDGRWTYEIKILTPAGERREVELDAKSLQILEVD